MSSYYFIILFVSVLILNPYIIFLHFPTPLSHPSLGEVPKDPRPLADTNSMANFERPPVIERLHSNVGKRKSTTPQKFVGECFTQLYLPKVTMAIGNIETVHMQYWFILLYLLRGDLIPFAVFCRKNHYGLIFCSI